jgi:GGDEF domain-containing protein
MERTFTAQQLNALVGQLEKIFDSVEITDPRPEAAAGFTLGYASHLGGTDCVLACPITVDGTPRTLRIAGPVTGTAQPEDPVAARELELYHDDMNRDFLSGTYNRRFWETQFCRRIGERAAQGTPVAVALVQVDGYPELVRRHGQPVADQLVCYVANLWKKFYDEGSEKVVARLTGATYAIGCAGADETDLENQLRVLYGRMNLTCTATVGMMCRIPFTLSIGCADTGEAAEWPALYALCDRRMRDQAERGGNGVFAVR